MKILIALIIVFMLFMPYPVSASNNVYVNMNDLFISHKIYASQIYSINDLINAFGEYSTPSGKIPVVENKGDYFTAKAYCDQRISLIAPHKIISMDYFELHAKFRVVSSKSYALTFGVMNENGKFYYGVANLPSYETAYGYAQGCTRDHCYASTEGIVVPTPSQNVIYDVVLKREGTTLKLIVNGELISQTQIPLLNEVGNPFMDIYGVSCSYSKSIVLVYDIFEYSVNEHKMVPQNFIKIPTIIELRSY